MQLMRIRLSCFLLLLSIGLHAQETIQEKENYSFSLEEAIEFIKEDELVEITPQSIRLRKKILDPSKRKR